jgi:ribonuclease HI
MAPLKAPGLDGLSADFFLDNWDIVGEEVSQIVLHALNSGVMNKGMNFTYIALIPKIKSPKKVSDFRPISLCNVIYKLVSKVLANRLKVWLPKIISPFQSAFIQGRLITDNIIAAYETLHTMHSKMYGKTGYMAIKLDMSKAYDRVEWGFLERVMRRMGFAERWIHLVMMCVTSTSYSVLVNGAPVGLISPSRGIRQGDLISPYLFLLCAESLSSLLSQAEMDGSIVGVPTSRRGPRINHIFFADDSLLFCKASQEQWQRLSMLLNAYEKASGQQLNKDKTGVFFSRNTDSKTRQKIMRMAGIPSSQRYDTYLGLPALVGKSRIAAFQGIKERVWKRLQDWKLNFLSQARKEVLLKAVIQAIPTYSMCVFLLPKALCDKINSLMHKFWWGYQKKEKGISWMSWSRMGLPKSRGGMGFRDLHFFNKALIAKQCWRLWKEEESITAKIMKAKYYPNESILEAKLGTKPSFIWRSIYKSKALVREGLIWRIGDGSKVHIWGDKWLPIPTTYCIQSPPKNLAPDAMVSDLIDRRTGGWKQNLLLENFNKEEVEAIQSIPISFTNQPDRQIWRGTMKGDFTVGSAYHMAKENEANLQASCSTRRDEGNIWKGIWNSNFPNVVKTFMWRACQNLLPTRENLAKQSIIKDPYCSICGLEIESTEHILWECSSSSDVWGTSLRRLQKKSCSAFKNFQQMAESIFQEGTKEEFEIFCVTARKIWLRRNEWIHEGAFTHPNTLALGAQQIQKEFLRVNQKENGEPQQGMENKWQNPPVGWLKVNCDAAIDRGGRRMGIGIILRDHEGKVRAAWSISRPGLVDPTAAEASALFHGLNQCKVLGVSKLVVEGDSKVIISAVQNREASSSRYGHLIDDLVMLLDSSPGWQMVHVRRESNRAAHGLAKVALKTVFDRRWDFSIPDCIRDVVLTESLATI